MRTKLTGAPGLLFLVLAVLAGCNLFGPPPVVPGGTTPQVDPPVEVRALPADFSERKAVAYAGVRGELQSDDPTLANVQEDLALLNAENFRLLRLFSSGGTFARRVLETIRDAGESGYDMKVQLGIWITGSKAATDAANQAEITAGVTLANEFPTIVAGVSVGNEKMVDWQGLEYKAPPADMIEYIKQVRGLVAQPVTTDDNWAVFANDAGKYPSTAQLLANLDYVAMHTYPLSDAPWGLWDWKQKTIDADHRAEAMMDAALDKAKADYQAVRDNLDEQGLDLPIVIGETGWKSAASDGEEFRAHPVNQKMYYDGLAGWTDGPVAIMYFEAFDEQWKGGDDMWGLWNLAREPKYVISGEGYEEADAVYYIAPVPNGTISKNNYLVYADTVAATADTAIPTETTTWIPWDVPGTATGAETTASGGDTAAEGSKYMKITPNPKDWGWGFFLNNAATDDLTLFQSSGHLKFSIRTTYAGKIEVGFFTKGDGEIKIGNADVYIPIGTGDYGYANDGAWHSVSIPIATIAALAAAPYGQTTPVQLNMVMVSSPLTIADRYDKTGKAQKSKITTKIDIDNIRWTRD